jgi:protoporphyrin/coproporphyrin ferrochelatase
MTVGVLVMAHGTPADAEGIEPFYTRIRRGRPPTPEQLEELEARYRAIGGVSPLTERTAAQVEGVRTALDARAPGRFVVAFGAKHTTPLIEDGAAALVSAGVERVVGLVLTPHGSSMGSGEYLERAAVALGDIPFTPVGPWYAHPGLVRLLADRVNESMASLRARGLDAGRIRVFFTAHSLPARVRDSGDTYPDQVADSAALVARAAGLDEWGVAWQSAGRTPEPWLGPDVRDVARELASAGTADAILVCPVGFVADHLEVLYDLDIELAAVAAECELAFARTASLNDDPTFVAVLADLVQQAAVEGGGGAEGAPT